MLISVLFGTTFNELLGKVLGLGRVPQIGPDVVVHLVRRVHFFQEGCKRGNWESSRGSVFESGFQKRPLPTVGVVRYLRLTIQVIGCVEGVKSLLTPLYEGVLLALCDPLEQL